MLIGEIDLEFVKTYLRQDSDDDDLLISSIIESAKMYVCNETGIALDDLNTNEKYTDVLPAMLTLIADWYDNRTISVTDKLILRHNDLIMALMKKHSVNLL